jgi:hypothetical protein
VSKDVRIHGYFSKPNRACKKKCLGNTSSGKRSLRMLLKITVMEICPLNNSGEIIILSSFIVVSGGTYNFRGLH